MNLIGQIINGMKIVGAPQRSGVRGSNYRYPCECALCGQHKDLTLQTLRGRKTYGCGCAIDGLITKNGTSFAQWCVNNSREDLLDLWDYKLNDVRPEQVSSQSQRQRWFQCDCSKHDSFLYSIPKITRRTNYDHFCPKCNSFAQHFIDRFGKDEFDAIWDYNNNSVNPWMLSYGSKQSIVVKCMNDGSHKPYQTTAKSLMRGRRCPECAKYIKTSKLQNKVAKYIEDSYHLDIAYEYDCSLICINPKTGYQLPYDNEIVVSDRRLIIEVHGEQHYVLNMWHKLIAQKHQCSPEQILQEQQWRDSYKEHHALKNGYVYLIIPYWTEQDDSYKILIDQKIQEILSRNTKQND